MIPLLNQDGEHLGFLLPADLPDEYSSIEGSWETECVFMALPMETDGFDDPAFAILESHKQAGEHHLAVSNDGTALSFVATAPTGEQIFVHLPDAPTGVWGTLEAGAETPVGHAVRIPDQDA
ncbi:hypothetical protein [Luteolibacter soli]|uniref:Uncharacterized protein n=1 Tax=Luteolibacter soli TaxID=3135280 RepID=A0ABU9ATI0_9BACT